MTPNLRETRLEHLIAYGRALLGICSLFAIWLDPTEPARFAQLTYNLLAIYALYAVVLAVWIQAMATVPARLAAATHALDIVAFVVFQYLTEGASSPFFTFFVFAFLVAVFRWNRAGLICTAAVMVPAFVALGYVNQYMIRDTAFELNRFMMRASYMTLIAIFLGFAATYDERRRRELRRLAVWSHSHGDTLEAMLAHAGAVLDAGRALLVWRGQHDDSGEAAATNVAYWSHNGVYETFESDEYWPPTSTAFAAVDFIRTGRSDDTIVRTDALDIRTVRDTPCSSMLRERYGIDAVLGIRITFGHVRGWLLALDQPRATTDDFFIGEMVGKQIAVALDNARLAADLQQHARVEERMKLGRDLHDGVLQSLTGAALRLEALRRRAIEVEQAEELGQIQRLVTAGQHDIRVFVNDLKSRYPSNGGMDLSGRLQALRQQAKERWHVDLQMELSGHEVDAHPALGHDIYLIALEAVVNAAKHGRASAIRLRLVKEEDALLITITDNGGGFPFRGRYEHEALVRRKLGPASVRERVAALAGRLAVESTDKGARLDIVLPLPSRS